MNLQDSRLMQIRANLDRDLRLLAEYESNLRLTSDPKERMKCQSEIEQLKSSIALSKSEQQELSSPPEISRITNIPKLARLIVTRDGRQMVLIPAGRFLSGAQKNERELHAFYIDRYPVTKGDYLHFLESTDRPVPGHWPDVTLPQGRERHPIINLTCSEAMAYAEWVGKRLPTEDEWEKAARGPDGRLWPWGNRFDERLCATTWRFDYDQRDTTMVGGFSPQGDSVYGVSDVGHIWEWTASWFESVRYKVVRGGPWRDTKEPPLVINRSFEDDRAHDVGFRCACNADRIADILASVLIG